MTTLTAQAQPSWTATVATTTRRISAVTAAGALVGLVVGGGGGRLAMLLLARLNPEATGVTSDDGFTMGRFSSETLNLLVDTSVLGVLGAGLYFALRGLMIGPRWFQVLSISVGPGVVAADAIVHTDGVDFTLDPVLLAIGLFLLIPVAYAAALTLVAERWLDPTGRFATAPWWLALLPLLLWIPLAPLLGVLVAGPVAAEAVRRTRRGAAYLADPRWQWFARAVLAVVFAISLAGLVHDTVVLT